MIIVHSFQYPFPGQDALGTYIPVDGKRIDVPDGTTEADIVWFRKPHIGGKHPAFKIQLDWEVDGNNGRKYKVALDDDNWSCNCHSFKFSGNKRTCKHVTQIQELYLS
jgi:hypothetical protein